MDGWIDGWIDEIDRYIDNKQADRKITTLAFLCLHSSIDRLFLN